MATIIASPDEFADAMAQFFAYESDDEVEALEVPDDLHEFLSAHENGPHLNDSTVRFLSANGVIDIRTFLLYSQSTFHDMISPLSTTVLPKLNRTYSLRDVKLYGNYVHANSLLTNEGRNIDLDSFNWPSFKLYVRTKRRVVLEDLKHAVGLAMESRFQARQAQQAHMLSIRRTLVTSSPSSTPRTAPVTASYVPHLQHPHSYAPSATLEQPSTTTIPLSCPTSRC